MNLRTDAVQKVLKPHVPDIEDLEIHSANFLSPHQLFLLANGAIPCQRQRGRLPLRCWRSSGISREITWKERWTPWAPRGVQPGALLSRRSATWCCIRIALSTCGIRGPAKADCITIPDLTQIPNLYDFSPDGHWLLLAQIQTTSGADPSVVELKTHKFVDELRGHEGTVLSMAFSRDTKKVVTACEDGKLRVFSVGDWKLLQTLTGHHGPVHRAEFSPNGKWIASAGEDQTVRVWSAEDGTLLQTLQESQEPLLDVAFSPDSRFIAASSEKLVLTWQRQGGD